MAKKHDNKLRKINRYAQPKPLNYNKLIRDGFVSNFQSCKIETLYALNVDTKEIKVVFSRVKFFSKKIIESFAIS